MSKIIKIQQKDDVLQLTWIINNICTNACSYCPVDLHSGKNHHYQWETAERFIRMLMERHQFIHLSVAGGEPTVSPHLYNLVDLLYSNKHTISITTNGARTVEYYDKLSRKINSISFSWHPEFEDLKFLEKVKAADEYTNVTVRVMMDSRYWDKCVEFYHLVNQDLSITVQPVRVQDWGVGNSLGRDYTPEQEEWLNTNHERNAKFFVENLEKIQRKTPSKMGSYNIQEDGQMSNLSAGDLVNFKMNDFRGWYCNVGLESLFVHWNGNIQRGNCRQGNPRIIGNINNPDEIQWPDKPEICNQRECHCITDVEITKWDPTHKN